MFTMLQEIDMETETKTPIKTYSIFDEEIFKTVTKGIQVSQLMNLKQACTTTGKLFSGMTATIPINSKGLMLIYL